MRKWDDDIRGRRDVIEIRTIWVAFVLSLIVHGVALIEFLPKMRNLALDALPPNETNSPLAVRLAPEKSSQPAPPPAPAPPPSLAQATPPAPVAKPRPPRTAPRPVPSPPAVAVVPPLMGPGPPPPSPPAVAAPKPTPAPPGPPAETDLAGYIAARRRERGESEPSTAKGTSPNAPPAESDSARRDRIVAANLASVTSQDFGQGPKNSGGVFQITRLGYADAEFTFYGWNKDIKRRVSQRIDVRRGPDEDIRMAVVRRMIAIVRDYEQEDFVWESRRLGRNVTLSARQKDTAELESFIMSEFFENGDLRH